MNVRGPRHTCAVAELGSSTPQLGDPVSDDVASHTRPPTGHRSASGFPRSFVGLALAWTVPLIGAAVTWALSFVDGLHATQRGGLQLSESGAMGSLGVVASLIVAVHVASWGLTRSEATDLAVAHRLNGLGLLGYVLAGFCGLLAVSYSTSSSSRFAWYVPALAAFVSWFGIDVARPSAPERVAIERARIRRTVSAIEKARGFWASEGAGPTSRRRLWVQAAIVGGGAGVVADLAMMLQLWSIPPFWTNAVLGLVVMAVSGMGIFAVNANFIIGFFAVLPGRRYSSVLGRAYVAGFINIVVLFAVGAAVWGGDGAAAWLLIAWAAPTLAVITQIVGCPGSRLWRPSSFLFAPVVAGHILAGLDRERIRLEAPPKEATHLLRLRAWVRAVTGRPDPGAGSVA